MVAQRQMQRTGQPEYVRSDVVCWLHGDDIEPERPAGTHTTQHVAQACGMGVTRQVFWAHQPGD